MTHQASPGGGDPEFRSPPGHHIGIILLGPTGILPYCLEKTTPGQVSTGHTEIKEAVVYYAFRSHEKSPSHSTTVHDRNLLAHRLKAPVLSIFPIDPDLRAFRIDQKNLQRPIYIPQKAGDPGHLRGFKPDKGIKTDAYSVSKKPSLRVIP